MFKRFFGRSDRPEQALPLSDHDADEAAAHDLDDETRAAVDDAARPADAEREWRLRAADVLSGGSSTGSKRPAALYGADDPDDPTDEGARVPTHYSRADGCRVVTAGGATFVDCTMALGAVALGYADEVVTASVVEALSAGTVCGLSPTLEVRVAERLCEVIPCAEQVRFLKTGAEAVAAAARIARVATNRTRVVGSGYFGWLDWASDAPGVPPTARGAYTAVPFDDVAALERAVAEAGSDLAAVVLEPIVEREPSLAWLHAARDACDRTGAVLVFDELKTGFRVRTGGYQEYVDITPDLATFGKAMANGFPLAAVVGRAAVMEAAARTWISSTLASETASLAAANAVLDWHERADVCESLWHTGAQMRAVVQRAIETSGVTGIALGGLPPMWLLRFDDSARAHRFVRYAVRHGALFKSGAYNFPSLAHDADAIAQIEYAASSACVALHEEREETA